MDKVDAGGRRNGMVTPVVAILDDLSILEELRAAPELHDALWLGSIYRLHRFRRTASPVKGLTADILMEIVRIAYARDAAFERWGPGQLKSFEEIQQAISACSQAALTWKRFINRNCVGLIVNIRVVPHKLTMDDHKISTAIGWARRHSEENYDKSAPQSFRPPVMETGH
ncbi:hypothetical protein BGW80DRAFT_1257982 [Lactifluus volemus]|nr:hypothetical protein BGW80DRAFT_1257982 [Lactifluus volemus]